MTSSLPSSGHAGPCYPSLRSQLGASDDATDDFGFNASAPGEPLLAPWKWLSYKDLGTNPEGQLSASVAMQYNSSAPRRPACRPAGCSSNCGQQQQQDRFVVPRSASHAPLPSPPPLPGAVPTSGYISLIIPFFSTHLLPEEKGHWSEVTDYRLYMYNVSSGASPVNYLCVRLSFNGEHVHQVVIPPRCDCTHAQSTPNARPMRSHAQLASAMGMQ